MCPTTTTTTPSSGVVPAKSSDPVPTPDNGGGNLTRKKKIRRPWYIRGGMLVNSAGLGISILGAIFALLVELDGQEIRLFCVVWVLSVLLSFAQGMTTLYCVGCIPTYFASFFFLIRTFDDKMKIFTVIIVLATTKVNICMSTCLHRYAAHGAFQCGPITSKIMLLLGCLANQGGPLWWASMHRCHHKFCDEERDPHSPIVDGIEKAFAFFAYHIRPEEEFVPKKLDTPINRFMDTWAWTVPALEQILSYIFFQRKGLFISFTSAWLSQSVTLWFNIVNHPIPEEDAANPPKKGSCMASDDKARPTGYFLPFHILDLLYTTFGAFVAETNHEHHHEHPQLAKRTKYDTAYWLFLLPLEQLGLIWGVNV